MSRYVKLCNNFEIFYLAYFPHRPPSYLFFNRINSNKISNERDLKLVFLSFNLSFENSVEKEIGKGFMDNTEWKHVCFGAQPTQPAPPPTPRKRYRMGIHSFPSTQCQGFVITELHTIHKTLTLCRWDPFWDNIFF